MAATGASASPQSGAGNRFSVDTVLLRERSIAVDAANDTSGAALRVNVIRIADARVAWAGTTQAAFDSVSDRFERADAALSAKLTGLATNLLTAARSYEQQDDCASDALTR
ncbi:MAG: WXG100 family type VII secretion target [Mycobacterium sp.]